LAVIAVVGFGAASAEAATSPAARGYVAGKYGIELDGVMAGWVWSVEGGHATSDVVVEKMGPDKIQRKHIGNVKYEDITITAGTGMSKAFYQWIQDTLDRKYSRKNRAIIAADYNGKEVSRMTFTNALITEIGMPALDAASKDAAKMTIKFKPELTRFVSSKGQVIKGALDSKVQKKWLPANFRLKIEGLDEATLRVTKIEALVIKQKVVESSAGERRDSGKEPAALEVPNLVITLPESHADAVSKWHEDFVIKGNNAQDKEKTGTLEYLTPDLKTVLFTLTFSKLGIFKLAPEKVEAGNEQIRRFKAEMYFEDIKFSYGAAWASSQPAALPAARVAAR
jgi:phage tail-like protein